MTITSRPRKVTLRAYSVGFGDCFLLSFGYPAEEGGDRHVLIDFGSTEPPDDAPTRDIMLQRVAEDIRERCDPKLLAVVATHRHADHINGFATAKNGKASGDIIRSCRPDFVIQPWTEDPKAPNDLTVAYDPQEDRKQFFAARAAMHGFSQIALKETERLDKSIGCNKGVVDHIRLLASNNLPNQSALQNLKKMGDSGRSVYLAYGQPSGLEESLPGVRVHVLGPPTLDQSREIMKQRTSAPDEFWQFYLGASPKLWQRLAEGIQPGEKAGAVDGNSLFPDGLAVSLSRLAPLHTRWFVRRMNAVRSEQLLEVVRILDGVLNNTSVILLFEIGKTKLLFPGDAQLENWSYALQDETTRNLLQGVSLYKVGHHGSRNATPKTLWNLIQGDGLKSVVSTKAGKHGKEDRNTEVPRRTLVEALKKYDFYSTQELSWRNEAEKVPSHVFSFEPIYEGP